MDGAMATGIHRRKHSRNQLIFKLPVSEHGLQRPIGSGATDECRNGWLELGKPRRSRGNDRNGAGQPLVRTEPSREADIALFLFLETVQRYLHVDTPIVLALYFITRAHGRDGCTAIVAPTEPRIPNVTRQID